MSSTSKHSLYHKAESTYGAFFGTIGGAAGTMGAVDHLSFTMNEDIQRTQSNSINPSRNPQDQITVDTRCTGQMGFELRYDLTWLSIFARGWLHDVNATAQDTDTDTTYGLLQTTNQLTSSDGGLCTEMPVISGDFLRVSGFSTNDEDMVVQAVEVTISGTYTAENGSMTARSGSTAGATVTGGTSAATGELVAIDTGANTYTIKVLTGQFVAGEDVGTSIGVNDITVIVISTAAAVLSNFKLTTEAAGLDITVRQLSRIRPGSTRKSTSFESYQSDVTNDYNVWLGCMFTRMAMNFPASGPITGAFDIKGSERVILQTSSHLNVTALSGNPVLHKQNVNIYMGGSSATLTDLTDTSADATTVCTTLAAHGLQTGDLIVISGNADGDNNRNWLVTRTSSTTFTLQGSTAQTAQSGSNAGQFRKLKIRKSIVSATWALDNQLREETELGTAGIIAQPIGTLAVGGTLEIYHANQSEQLSYQGDEYLGVTIIAQEVQDPTHIVVLEHPRIKYLAAPSPIERNNDSRVQNIQWAASLDPDWGFAASLHY